MRRLYLLIAMIFAWATGYAQKPHPKDREIEAAIRAYYKGMEPDWILEEFKYVESEDISEKEYVVMAAGKFESYMYISKYFMKENKDEQERIEQKKKQTLNDLELLKRYDDTLAQLAADIQKRQDEFDRNKISLDSCEAIVKRADSVNNFGYLAYVLVKARNRNVYDPYIEKEIEEFIVTKDMKAYIYMRLEKDQLAFIRE